MAYGQRTVLSIDNLEIQQGLIYGLLGPNGAGKSTLLNILGFLEQPTSGQIRFDGNVVDHSRNHLRQLRRQAVVVGQRPVMFTTSVYKNMEFGLKIRGFTQKERRAMIDEALELVGMRHLIQAEAHTLSGGETQRVVLARALVLSPRMLICDEPTSSVDLESQLAIIALLRQINQEKQITLILSSHDRLQTTSLAHHTLFLDHGKLFDGAYENMFQLRPVHREGRDFCYTLNNAVTLCLPAAAEGRNRILLDPWRIELITPAEPSSSDNILKGVITQIIQEQNHIRLVLDCRIQLVLMLTQEHYQSQKPMIGETVSVRIGHDACRML